jgi:hypothetical protein
MSEVFFSGVAYLLSGSCVRARVQVLVRGGCGLQKEESSTQGYHYR